MTRLGIGFSWRESSLQSIVAAARDAEQAGVESVWMPEAWGREAFLALAAVAQVTDRVKLGTGIVNVFSRSPATLAMSAATLDELSHGRVIVGVGSSGPGVVERWHGIHYEAPLTRVREAVEIIRLALAGNVVSFSGKVFHVSDFKLAMNRSKGRTPIYISALGPKMLRLAGEVADGVLLYLCPLSVLPHAISEIRKGADRIGRALDNFEIAYLLPTAFSENAQQAREMVARAIAYYVGGMGTYYRRQIAETGFQSEASKIGEAWQRGDRLSATKAVSQQLVDSVALACTPSECKEKLQSFRESGITLPILSVSNEGNNLTSEFWQTIKTLTAA